MSAPDIYETDDQGVLTISPRKIQKIISERDELRVAVETMADDLAILEHERWELQCELAGLKG